MKTVKVGTVEVREDLKITKGALIKRFKDFLNAHQLEELAKKLKKNDVRRAKSKNKKVRIEKRT